MKLIISALLFLFLFLVINVSVSAQEWYYPMDRYFERQNLKRFGQRIDDDFYKDKGHLFPFNRFYGYHAAVDLEYLPGEKNKSLPVYAVTTGKIKYIGNLQGYGGVILQNIGEGNTALYGHVKIVELSYKVGGEINAGEILSYLGDEFSNETSRERKHLHFGIYRGTELYFKGHEASREIIERKWIDPTKYLTEKGAMSPGENNQLKTSPPKQITKQNFTIWDTLAAWLKRLFLQ